MQINKFLIYALGLSFLVACSSEEGNSKGDKEEDISHIEWEHVALDSSARELIFDPEVESYNLSRKVSANGELLAEFNIQTQNLKTDTLGLKIIKMEVDEWVRSNFYLGDEDYKEKSLDSLIAKYEAFLKAESESIGFATNWEISAGASVAFNHFGLMTYELSVYSYTGGAHGNGMIEFRNYDVISGSRLTLGDMFSDTLALKKMMNDQFNSTMPNEIKENIYVDEIPLTSNICLGSDSLTFFFNSYEIGPYAMGPVELRIAVQDLNPILKLKVN